MITQDARAMLNVSRSALTNLFHQVCVFEVLTPGTIFYKRSTQGGSTSLSPAGAGCTLCRARAPPFNLVALAPI